MSDEKPKKIELNGLDPKKPFYMAVSAYWSDGSINDEGCDEMHGLFPSQVEAEEKMRAIIADNPGYDGYIFHCVPIIHMGRGPIRTKHLKGR